MQIELTGPIDPNLREYALLCAKKQAWIWVGTPGRGEFIRVDAVSRDGKTLVVTHLGDDHAGEKRETAQIP